MSEPIRNYAEALFALATESGQQKDYLTALEQAQAVIHSEPDYLELLCSPAIPRQERVHALQQALDDTLPAQVRSFLCLLCEHGQMRRLTDCIDLYRQLYEAAARISTARVVSAVPLTQEQREKLRRRLEQLHGGTVQLDCTTNETLLGGISVELDGKVLDGSLRHRLHDVKEVMKQ